MPDSYFRRPCPACGGRVRHREGDPFAECTACGRRFTLKDPPPQNGSAEGTPKGAPQKRSFLKALLSKIKTAARAIRSKCSALYASLYRKIRKKNDRIPLPRPEGIPRLQGPSEGQMDQGQRALYNARKQQLATGGNAHVVQSEPTKSERLESFVLRHRVFSIVTAALAVLLLLTLLTVGIAFCVKEASINKDPFRIYYGTEDDYDRHEYKFIAFKTPDSEVREISHRINMTKIAALCDLTISGTANAPKYALRGGSAYVKFESGSDLALVNGSNYQMDCPATYDENGDLWVDLYFADSILGGMEIGVDLETNTITVTRNTTPEGTVLDPVYETISISAGNHSSVPSSGNAARPTATYKIDISAYAADLYPTDTSYLILANKEHPLGADYVPADLTEADVSRTKTVELRASAARALEAMFAEMKEDGVTDISVTSSYRSYTYQEGLFSYYVSEYQKEGYTYDEAVKLVESDTARPGYSEHQTGLCVDFLTSSMNGLSNEFENTEAFVWLRENAWKFGFILRYPSDKIDTTGYTYESWHYRFVGVDAATEIHTSGWCFEEYLERQ